VQWGSDYWFGLVWFGSKLFDPAGLAISMRFNVLDSFLYFLLGLLLFFSVALTSFLKFDWSQILLMFAIMSGNNLKSRMFQFHYKEPKTVKAWALHAPPASPGVITSNVTLVPHHTYISRSNVTVLISGILVYHLCNASFSVLVYVPSSSSSKQPCLGASSFTFSSEGVVAFQIRELAYCSSRKNV
jgi:hypothetical protein